MMFGAASRGQKVGVEKGVGFSGMFSLNSSKSFFELSTSIGELGDSFTELYRVLRKKARNEYEHENWSHPECLVLTVGEAGENLKG